MCCGKLLLFFFIFAMVQIQLRWKRDDTIIHKPWRVAFKGQTNQVLQKTASDIIFQKQKISYGEVPLDIIESKLISKERTEVEITMEIELHGPPLSFHRLSLLFSTKEYTTDIFVPYSGVAHVQATKRMVMIPDHPISFKHTFDSVWNVIDNSSIVLTVGIRNGLPNLYDAPWTTL